MQPMLVNVLMKVRMKVLVLVLVQRAVEGAVKGLLKGEMKGLVRASLSILMTASMLLTALAPFSARATELVDLQRAGEVELIAWLGDDAWTGDDKASDVEMANFSVNEQIILNIEVATSRWFTGGTRIGSVEIPDVIAKQRNQFATNYTQRRGSTTWARQRWQITLYPTQSGDYVVPPIAVKLQVNTVDNRNVAGTLYTEPMRFSARLPSGQLGEGVRWFSATDVEVEQAWAISNESPSVGDSITRTVTVTAEDSLSVLIPNLLVADPTAQYQAYPQPHRLSDSHERSHYQSERTEQTVYVIQQGGTIRLPEITFYWWNSQESKLETVQLAGREFQVSHTLQSFLRAYAAVIVLVVGTVIALVVAIFSLRRYYQNHPKPAWLLFHRMVKNGEWSQARRELYRQLRLNTAALELGAADASAEWQARSEAIQQGEENRTLMRSMWQAIKAKGKNSRRGRENSASSEVDKSVDVGQSKSWWRFSLPPALPALKRRESRRE